MQRRAFCKSTAVPGGGALFRSRGFVMRWLAAAAGVLCIGTAGAETLALVGGTLVDGTLGG